MCLIQIKIGMSEKVNYIEKLKDNPELLKTLPKEFLEDKEIIKVALVRLMPYYISDDVFFSMFKSLELFELIDISLKNDVEFVNELMDVCSGYLFQYLPDTLRKNKEVYQFAVKRTGFEYVFNRLLKESIGDENIDIERLKNLEEPIRNFLSTISITEYAGSEILKDKESILIALERDPLTFQFLNDEMKSDIEISNKALSFGSLNMRQLNKKEVKTSLPKRLKYIKDLKKKPYLLNTLPKEYLSDKEIVKAALIRKWHDYEFNFKILEIFKDVDKTLRYDVDFIKELMESCSGYLFEYLPLALREDEDVLFFALRHSGYDYIYDKMKQDAEPDEEHYNEDYVDDISYELYLHICHEKSIMCHAGKNLLRNKEVVEKTLEFEEDGFYYASDELNDDKELALEAVLVDATNFQNLSETLRDDEEIALATAEANGAFLEEFDYHGKWSYLNSCFFQKLSFRLQNDRSFIIKLISNVYGAEFVLEYLSESFKNDKKLVLIAVKKSGEVLQFASDSLKSNKKIVMAAFKKNDIAFRYASKEVKDDKKFVLKILQKSISFYEHISDRLKKDKDILATIFNTKVSVFRDVFFLDKLLNNQSLFLEIVNDYPFILEYASDKLKDNKEFVLEVIKENSKALEYVNERFQNAPDILALKK